METDVFPLTPDYEVEVEDRDGVLRFEAESRARVLLQRQPAQRIFTLPFRERSTNEVEQLRDWKRRFAASYFRLDHPVWLDNAGAFLTRSFPVEWLDDSLPERLLMNNSYDFVVRLIEAVGRPLIGNFLSSPGDLSAAAWTKSQCTVAADSQLDLNGVLTADRITPNAGATDAQVTQTILDQRLLRAAAIRGLVKLRAASGTPSIKIFLQNETGNIEQTCNLTTSLQEFAVAGTMPFSTPGRVDFLIGAAGSFVEADGPIDVLEPIVRIDSALGLYPTPAAGHATRRIEDAEALASGTWGNFYALAFSGGSLKYSNETNAKLTWVYGGYGFRLVGSLGPARGKVEISLDGVVKGVVDTYKSSTQDGVILFELWDVPLGLHRVTARVTGLKNAAATDTQIVLDYLEVVP